MEVCPSSVTLEKGHVTQDNFMVHDVNNPYDKMVLNGHFKPCTTSHRLQNMLLVWDDFQFQIVRVTDFLTVY